MTEAYSRSKCRGGVSVLKVEAAASDVEPCGVLALALADAIRYINSNIQLLGLTITAITE